MARILLLAFAVWLAFAFAPTVTPATAQDIRPELGDPPIASRIVVGLPDDSGIVRIDGGQGSVFGNATVAVRNLYTGETVYTVAGGLGSWTVRLYGPGETPFWISPHPGSVSDAREAFAGSLPGGPGVIIYGSAPAPPPSGIITQIALDGDIDDWALYPGTNVGEARALYNNDSLYIALSSTSFLLNYSRIEIIFTIDTITYGVRFDPRGTDAPLLRQLNPGTRDFGAIPAAYILDPNAGALEARIPLDFVDRALRLTFNRVRWLDATDTELTGLDISLPALRVDERDGIVRPPPTTDLRDVLPFDAGGIIDGGSWTARGRATQTGRSGAEVLRLSAGDTLRLELDVRLTGNNLPPAARILGQIRLQPIATASDADGDSTVRAVADSGTNFGWSNIVTPSGLPIDDVSNRIELGAVGVVEVLPHQVIRRAGVALFALDFALTLPDDLPVGLYVPVLDGGFALPDGTFQAWSDDNGNDPPPIARLPLVINTGVSSRVMIPWALFMDAPNDGARGILPDEEGQSVGALSNRVRYNPGTYIIAPRDPGDNDFKTYSLEPYLPMLLPNRYDSASAPLMPLLPSSGQLAVRVTRPDGSVDEFGLLSIVQNALSTVTSDEAALFGTTTPVDMYRLTTLDPRLTAYTFDQYGEYQIDLRGEVSDRFGNRYTGGGSYRVFVADTLDMLPAVLPGTPFETGDAFHPGVHLYPSVPANVTIRLRIYPFDGSAMIERIFNGRATRFGILSDQISGATPFIFEKAGEYTVDYEVRYTGLDGRLWAASLRGAGVIAARDEFAVVAHGTRGAYASNGTESRRAWYSAAASGLTGGALTTLYPYHSGDVLWAEDTPADRVRPSMFVQDVSGTYQDWMLNALDPATVIEGEPLERRAAEDELPFGFFTPTMPDRVVGTSQSYAYISAVRPGVTVRQMVTGSLMTNDSGWTPDDPYNRQIGAGFNGDLPGDFTFLFGGTVLDYGAQRLGAIYGSLLVRIDPDDPRGTRIYPPGRGAAGAGDGGALVTARGTEYGMFFQPMGVRPGDIYRVGDTFSLSGQVAPPLPSHVSAMITAPSGAIYTVDGTANRVGYFYEPESSFVLNEAGVWTIDLIVQHEGWTSAGMVEPPYPSGTVLGSDNGRFSIYVLASDIDVLDWNPRLTDTLIPPAVTYNFSFTLPAGWRDLRALYTVTTPGYIVDAGEIRLSGRSFTYLYNPSTLSERFEFLENITRAPGQLGAERSYVTDQRILTFYASGIDAEGARRTVARTFVLWYDRLISLD